MGYLKGRQVLKQSAIAVHQNSISDVDDDILAKKQPSRLKEMIRLSNTIGAPSSEQPIDKIMERTESIHKIKVVPGIHETIEEAEKDFDVDLAMRKALLDEENGRYASLPLLTPTMSACLCLF